MLAINQTHINDFTKALLELANENNQIDVISKDITSIQQHLSTIKETLASIAFKTLAKQEQLTITSNIFKVLGISNLFYSATKALITNQDYNTFIYFIENWNTIKLSYQGYKHVEVISVIPLTQEQTNKLQDSISKQFSDKFFLTFTIDKTILGGLIIKVEGLLFDDSLKNKLQNIQNFVKEH
jgi:F-type H+-transporting ATPase subunit delta